MTRRSIRQFENRPVSPEQVAQLLRAAMAAPSAGNEQSWQFVVIDSRQVLDEIATMHPNAEMAARAPLAVMVCGDLAREQHKGYWVQDCSAATQNLLLAAHALGLGAVWSGIYPVEGHVAKFRSMFQLPAHILPLSLLVMGVPAEAPGPADRYDPDRVHHNAW